MAGIKTNPIHDAWRGVFAQRDRRPIYEWAEDEVELFPPLTKTGRFDVSSSRHFMSVFDALQDERTREVNLLKPVRGGGTLIADVWCPWTIVNDPGSFMFVLQTDPIAAEHAEAILSPILNNIPAVQQLFPDSRHQKRNSEIIFNSGHPFYINGPSVSNLQTKGIRYMVEDECWCWDSGRMGDADGRVGDFLKMELSKILRISQGGAAEGRTLDNCEWFRAYNRGTVHEWEVACQHCGKWCDPIFSGQRPDGSFWGITWTHYKTPNGDWDLAKCIPTVHFECPHCAQPSLDCAKTKSEWNRTGRYRIVGEDIRRRVSFHFETVIDFPWADLVELWLDACNAFTRGDIKPKMQFYQKRRAMFMDENGLLRGGLNLKRVVYELNSTMPDAVARFMTIDKQADGVYWWTVREWSREKSRRVAFGKAFGADDLEEKRKLYKVPTFLETGGRATGVGIDCAHEPKGDRGVYSMAIKYGWLCLRGDAAYEFTHKMPNKRYVLRSYSKLEWGDPEIGTPGQGNRRFYAPLIYFSKPNMNQKVQEMIENGTWEEPITERNEMEDEYSAQMSARVKVTEFDKKTNQRKSFWKEAKNDHARDLANQQTTMAIQAGLVNDPVTERLSETERKAA